MSGYNLVTLGSKGRNWLNKSLSKSKSIMSKLSYKQNKRAKQEWKQEKQHNQALDDDIILENILQEQPDNMEPDTIHEVNNPEMSHSSNKKSEASKSTDLNPMTSSEQGSTERQPNKNWSSFLTACHSGSTERVRSLLEEGIDVNEQDEEGATGLMLASEAGHTEIIEMLLKKGAQVDTKKADGTTALYLSSFNGHFQVSKLLLQHGAQVDVQTGRYTTLMVSAKNGHISTAKLLLVYNAQVNMQNRDKMSALMYASSCGHASIVRALLDHGAQVDMQTTEGSTALMQGSLNGHVQVVEVLLDHGAQINMQDNSGTSALMYACHNKQTEVVKLLLERNANIDLQGNNGRSALIKASKYGHSEVVKVLLEYGCQVNMIDSKGCSSLIYASAAGHCQVVKELLAYGVQVDVQTTQGSTALMQASSIGHIQIAKLLLDHGAQVNMQDNSGTSALMYNACHNKQTEIVKLLLDRNANIDMQGNNGRSAIMKASKYGHPEVVKVLLDYGCQVNMTDNKGLSALMHASVGGHHQVVKRLLECGAQVDWQDNKGYTALMIASIGGHTEVANMLLEHGARVNLQGNEGLTALTCALSVGRFELGELLLKHGAQVDLKGRDGKTALMKAVEDGHIEAVKFLLKHNAQIDLQSNEGQTVLMMGASTDKYSEATQFLLECGANMDLVNSNGQTALMLAIINTNSDLAIDLINAGAQVNIQDNDGWSALMYAVNSEDSDVIQFLITHGADIHLQSSEEKTIHDVCPEALMMNQYYLQTLLTTVNYKFYLDANYPGITLYGAPVKITDNVTGDLLESIGISVSFPHYSAKESLELQICPCFSGPFELPADYEQASPAYLINHSKMHFQNDVTIRMHHYASLQSEEDCEDMAFLTASSTPEYRGSRPVYIFKEKPGVRGVFKPGDQVGEISLRSFCLKIVGKRKRSEESDDSSGPPQSSSKKHQGDCYYSARLYRSVEHQGEIFAVFCMCLYHPIYIEHCNTVIKKDYSGGISEDFAEVLEHKIVVCSNDASGLHVKFDKVPTQILKRDIHIPEILNIDVGKLLEYPPRLSISIQTTPDFTSPELQVHGLDRECGFNLLPIPIKSPPATQQKAPGTWNLSSGPLSPENQATENCLTSLIRTPPLINYLQALPTHTGEISVPQVHVNAPTSPHSTSQPLGRKDTPTKRAVSPLSEGILDIDDLSDVLDAVESLSSKWRLLLTKLGVKQSTLDRVKTDNAGNTEMCLYEALVEWLNLNYDHQRHGRPSWTKLVKAVSSLNFALSESIAQVYALT